MRTRFAPSPTGYLHLGHVRAAGEALRFAKAHGGECWLRLEDTDHTRCKPEYTQAILDDLAWLGYNYPAPVRVQSAHYPDYAQVATDLLTRGLAYPCSLTRAQIKAGANPHHDKVALKEEFGKDWRDSCATTLTNAALTAKPTLPFSIRLDLPKAIASVSPNALSFEDTGPLHKGQHDAALMLSAHLDPIIARKDIGCSYMIAGPHDDAVQAMTHIVRGADLFSETPLQILLQALMGWPRPVYHHHGLVMSNDGKKLSKRSFAASVAGMREAGISTQEVLTQRSIDRHK